MRLQLFIAATGLVYFIFAYFVPTMSDMRNYLATSAILTIIYDVALLVILIKDGNQREFSFPGLKFGLMMYNSLMYVINMKENQIKRRITEFAEAKRTKFSMPSARLLQFLSATPLACCQRYRYICCSLQ